MSDVNPDDIAAAKHVVEEFDRIFGDALRHHGLSGPGLAKAAGDVYPILYSLILDQLKKRPTGSDDTLPEVYKQPVVSGHKQRKRPTREVILEDLAAGLQPAALKKKYGAADNQRLKEWFKIYEIPWTFVTKDPFKAYREAKLAEGKPINAPKSPEKKAIEADKDALKAAMTRSKQQEFNPSLDASGPLPFETAKE